MLKGNYSDAKEVYRLGRLFSNNHESYTKTTE